jgi:hypothetical protein
MDLAAVYNSNDKDPNTLTFNEAMKDDNKVIWIEDAVAEIRSLVEKDCWDAVLISDATITILPGTWTFRRKRTSDVEVQKYKARYCVRGDLQKWQLETYAPVVAWATVWLFPLFRSF